MSILNEKFATAFANVPTAVTPLTDEVTTMTLYVKPGGEITSSKPANFEAQGEAIAREKQKNTPKNTKSVYTPKAVEFQGFCRSLYGTTPQDQFVTADKLFGFLYYQAHRGKYLLKRETGFFDRVDYDKVCNKVTTDVVDHDMVGSQAIQQYLGAVRNIFDIQLRQGVINIDKSSLMTDRVKDLIKLVGKRKERVMKLLHKERLDGEFQPFQLVDEVPKIEAELWNVSSLRSLQEQGRWSHSCFNEYV